MNTKNKRIGVLGATVAGLAAACGTTAPARPPAQPAAAATESSWISVGGTVVDTTDDSFVLDYGDGELIVMMDSWEWFPEGRQRMLNDDVIVYGYPDEKLYVADTLRASSVYVPDLGTQFYASDVDDDRFRALTVYDFRSRVELRGTVTNVENNSFALDTGHSTVRVDTSVLGYDPLDDEGFQRVEAGDRVRVTGKLDSHLLNDLDFVATSVTTLDSSG